MRSDSDNEDDLSGPVSVDEFLEQDGPVSIDDYMDPETEAKAEQISTMLAVTESLKSVLSAATDLASRVRSEEIQDVKVCESDPVEQTTSEKKKADITYDNPTVEQQAPKKSKNDEDESETKNDDVCTPEIVADTCDDNDYSSSDETEVGSNRSIKHSSRSTGEKLVVEGREIEGQGENQEWTYDDLLASVEQSIERRQDDRQRDREQKRQERYETAEKGRISKIIYFAVFCLALEIASTSIAVRNYQPLVECCERSIFSENEAVGEGWNKAFYLLGILFLPFIILVEIPTLIIAKETLFLFNPMIGYLLAMHMLYTTNVTSAWAIFGLESIAMLGQSWVLTQLGRSHESCIHSTFNYTLAGITVYMIVKLTQQGGYCIVDDRIQSVFADQTCNIQCIDADSCFRCDGNKDESFIPQCFIQFPTDETDIFESSR